MSEQSIDSALLRVVSSDAGYPQAFAHPPVPISGGFWAAIYGFELLDPPDDLRGRLVLRVMPNAVVGEVETIVHREVAAQGYPTPRVAVSGFDAELGGAFIVMERVDGAQLLAGVHLGSAVLRLPKIVRRIAHQLASASTQLHRLDPEPVMNALTAAGVDVASLGPHVRLAEIRAAANRSSAGFDGLLTWLEDHRPSFEPAVVCHGDIHPFNMLAKPDGSFDVLDWTNGCLCRREYDVGCTAALLHCPPIAVPRLAEGVLRAITGSLARRFVDAYRRTSPVNLDVVEWFETLQYGRCLGSVALAPLDDPIIGPKHPFRISASAMARQVRMITGTTIDVATMR